MTDRTTYGDGRSPSVTRIPPIVLHDRQDYIWRRPKPPVSPESRLYGVNATSIQIQCKSNTSINANSMTNQWKVNANPMQIQCKFNVSSMQVQWKLNANSMQIICRFNTHSKHIQCRFNAHSIHIQCRLNAISMQNQGTTNANLMRSEIIEFNFNKPWHVLSWWGLFEAK